ncbi:MAG TPA: hypothetical protein ENI23_09935 [bacterium]|nr:hypothetical protein [bacterium]
MKSLHKQVVSKRTYKLLQDITQNRYFKEFYLVGGTALALQIGHRVSEDLDFFSQDEFKSNIIKKIKKSHEIVSLHDNSIEVIIENTKVFFFYFAFPLLNKIRKTESIRMADPIDIGLMKLLALQGRTTKKDIIDLYFIDKEVIELEDLLERFEKRYPKESFNSYKSLKTLLDYSSLDSEKLPRVIKRVNWKKVSDLVSSKVSKHLKKFTH